MPRINLSKIAEDLLYQAIKLSKIPPDKGLRVNEVAGNMTLVTDRPSKDDRIIKKDKGIVIIIDKELEKKIGNATIDIRSINKKLKIVIIKGEDNKIVHA